MIKIKGLIINPNSDEQMTQGLKEIVKDFSPEHIELDIQGMKTGPKFIDSKETINQSYAQVYQTIKDTSYDLYILACHLDPNLEKLREATGKIIIGIGQASVLLAQGLGLSYSIIGSSPKTVALKRDMVESYGASKELDHIGYPDQNLEGGLPERLCQASKEAKDKYSTDSIILGCAGFVGVDAYIENKLDLEVIDGLIAAIILADGYAKYKKFKNKFRQEK